MYSQYILNDCFCFNVLRVMLCYYVLIIHNVSFVLKTLFYTCTVICFMLCYYNT